jgi:quinol monooxygenase YgiN
MWPDLRKPSRRLEERMSVTIQIKYKAQPEKHEAAAGELAALVQTVTATERGCLGITIFRGESDGEFLLHEQWTDKETYFGPHMQTAHIQSFIGRAAEFFQGPPEITVWYELEKQKKSDVGFAGGS